MNRVRQKLNVKKSQVRYSEASVFKNTRSSIYHSSAGFTIIEVLFVLAIAGIIMLMVFAAIPALERNSRNNQRRQDISIILQGVSRYELNNLGNLADTASLQTYLNTYTKLSYYSSGAVTTNVYFIGNTSNPPANVPPRTSTNPLQIDRVVIYNYQRCDSSGDGGANGTGAGYSDVVALYEIETGAGVSAQCQQL